MKNLMAKKGAFLRVSRVGISGMIGVMAALTLTFAGCSSSKTNKKIDERVANESVDSQSELDAESKALISSAPKITTEQRSKLMTLRNQTRTEMERLGEESIKLRALLIEDIVATQYNESEVRTIKKRIRDVESDRISAIFNAVERANIIMGREAAVNPKVMESFFWMREGRPTQ